MRRPNASSTTTTSPRASRVPLTSRSAGEPASRSSSTTPPGASARSWRTLMRVRPSSQVPSISTSRSMSIPQLAAPAAMAAALAVPAGPAGAAGTASAGGGTGGTRDTPTRAGTTSPATRGASTVGPPASTSRLPATAMPVGAPSRRPPSAAARVSSAGRRAAAGSTAPNGVPARASTSSAATTSSTLPSAPAPTYAVIAVPAGRLSPAPSATGWAGSSGTGLGIWVAACTTASTTRSAVRRHASVPAPAPASGTRGEAEKLIGGPRCRGGAGGSRVRHESRVGDDEDGERSARRPGDGVREGRRGGGDRERGRGAVLQPDDVAHGEPADDRRRQPLRREPDGHLDLDVGEPPLGAFGRLAAGGGAGLGVLREAHPLEGGREHGVGDAQRGRGDPIADGQLQPGDDDGIGGGGRLHEARVRLERGQLGLDGAERLQRVGELVQHAPEQVPQQGLLDVGERPVGLFGGAGASEQVVDEREQGGGVEGEQRLALPGVEADDGANGLLGQAGEVLVVAELLDHGRPERADHPQARREYGRALPAERLHGDA